MAVMRQSAPGGAGDMLAMLVRDDGSGAHAHVRALAISADTAALADAAHFLCIVHGRFPGVMDHAAERVSEPAVRGWMFRAAAGFAAERAHLARLSVAAGPMPRRIGQAQAEAAVNGQTHAFAVLAQSERRGTALGAAFALALDWPAIRAVLDAAAAHSAFATSPIDLPGEDETLDIAEMLGAMPGVGRAMAFGAQQLLLQHRALWDVLETRAGLPLPGRAR